MYNIEPVPFQISDRHSASMVNSYFNILIKYGDQFEVLGFNDLIEVKHGGGAESLEVQLRNPEYDITRSITKVMRSFNNTDNLFASLKNNIKFVGYISDSTLPDQLTELHGKIKESLTKYQKDSKGKLELEFKDPSKDTILAKQIADDYGFKPQMMSLFAQETFYFYLTIQEGDKVHAIGIPDDLSIDAFNNSLDSTLKRLAPGFLRTVGLVSPPEGNSNPMFAQYGMPQGGKQFRAIQQKLGENFRSESVDLESGNVASDIDILLVLAPKDLNEKQVFAIDQFLMKGGTVILSTSPLSVDKQRHGFSAQEYNSGLQEWLDHFGINIPKEFVLDEKNTGFPAIRKRMVQGVTINEPYMAPYPFFIDVRGSGLNNDHMVTSGLGQVTMSWTSPIIVADSLKSSHEVTTLLTSSEQSWRTDSIDLDPNMDAYPKYGFPVGDKKESTSLGVLIKGSFKSYFAGKTSPLMHSNDDKHDSTHHNEKDQTKEESVVTSVIEKSPESSRLIVFSTNEFVADDTLQISGMLNGTQYLNSLQIVENTLDWSTDDSALLAIRSRGHFARTLAPLADDEKQSHEFFNYALALFGLLMVYGCYKYLQKQNLEKYRRYNLA